MTDDAGMTDDEALPLTALRHAGESQNHLVTPAQAGAHLKIGWIPAFAG
jgi:hypothetical protein